MDKADAGCGLVVPEFMPCVVLTVAEVKKGLNYDR